ncbi:hypothetical protein QR680_014370 [Steinernema hermaphroditum]|uniref:Methyltransferase FkbM domain-containing protein n=1 Tax=Steinernema hermaphroditum TaxID=289476 RepID=A0AA39M435_9BILA|nr:hypothetical protein QR680_014370 [Steinernema hermaphroditum]
MKYPRRCAFVLFWIAVLTIFTYYSEIKELFVVDVDACLPDSTSPDFLIWNKKSYEHSFKWRHFITYGRCIERRISCLSTHQTWNRLPYIVEECEKTSELATDEFSPLRNSDETKYHLKAKSIINQCLVLSVGVGLDIKAEQELQQVQPECRFVGSDPTPLGNRELYEKIGTFYPYAIGDQNGKVESLVINGFDKGYSAKTVVAQELVTFLNHLNASLVDNMFLDAEYAEYGLLPYFLKGGELDKANKVICQINIEIHYPSPQQEEDFAWFLRQLLAEKRYALFHVSKVFFNGHLRVVLLNYGSDKCADRYFAMASGALVM